MSLWSIISGNGSQAASPHINSTYSAALAKLQGETSAGAAETKPVDDATGISISADAQAAAAETEDNQKDFTDLSNDVRSTLDAQYAAAKAAGKDQVPDLSGMSGRALAAIVLNQSGKFMPAEQRAAKAALDQQTRNDFAAATGGGMSMSSLASYSQSLVQQYDAMSPEERQARGWTEAFRDNAAKVVSEGSLSLFDQIDDGSGLI